MTISSILTDAEESWLCNVRFAFSQMVVSEILSPTNCFSLIQNRSNFSTCLRFLLGDHNHFLRNLCFFYFFLFSKCWYKLTTLLSHTVKPDLKHERYSHAFVQSFFTSFAVLTIFISAFYQLFLGDIVALFEFWYKLGNLFEKVPLYTQW